MALMEVLIWPDPKLAQVAKPVEKVDDSIRDFAKDLVETMYAEDGGGLAATQVGVPWRIFAIDITTSKWGKGTDGPVVLINPVFKKKEGKIEWEEACLSVPGESGFVTRAYHVIVDYLDLGGNPQTMDAEGLLAIALQHENDHLDGKVWVDYQGKLKRSIVQKKMQKLKKSLAEQHAERVEYGKKHPRSQL